MFSLLGTIVTTELYTVVDTLQGNMICIVLCPCPQFFSHIGKELLCCVKEHNLVPLGLKTQTFLSGPEVIKLFSFSAQLRQKLILLINVKMPTIVIISS